MRKLTKSQKKILNQFKGTLFFDDLPSNIIEKLESINDYETLWQDVERYLWDINN